MKNIYVLPTEKSSRFYSTAQTQTKKSGYSFGEHYIPNTRNMFSNHNIYITNDDKIKEGDFVLYTKGIKIHHIKIIDEGDIELANIKDSGVFKIIITTDQDLIKDGVQAIDDDFLEWFVKNPSCEEVKVDHERVLWEDGRITHYTYKIIIQKEEPKPFKQMEKLTEVDWKKFKKNPIPSKKEEHYERTTQSISLSEVDKEESCNCTDECLGYLTKNCKGIKEEPKQETLEEVVFKVPFNYNIKPKEVIDMCMKEQENIILTWRLGHFIDMINSLPDDTEKNRILKSVFDNRDGELLLESYKSMKSHYEK